MELVQKYTWIDFLGFYTRINTTELLDGSPPYTEFEAFMEDDDSDLEVVDLGIEFAKKEIDLGGDPSDMLNMFMKTLYDDANRYSTQDDDPKRIIQFLMDHGATGLGEHLWSYPSSSFKTSSNLSKQADNLCDVYYNMRVTVFLTHHFGPLGLIPEIQNMDLSEVEALDAEELEDDQMSIDLEELKKSFFKNLLTEYE